MTSPSPRPRTPAPGPPPIVLTVANLKGGAGKTTTAVFCAHVLHERGRHVLLVDADPQCSALTWSELAGFPFHTVAKPSKRLHAELPSLIAGRWDAVVIDTPPRDDQVAIVASALRASSHRLVPCAPTGMEVERLRRLAEVLDDADTLRATGEPEPATAVLLNRTVPHAAMTVVYREQMRRDGWRVLAAAVGRLERFAQAYGEPVERATESSYGDAVTELVCA